MGPVRVPNYFDGADGTLDPSVFSAPAVHAAELAGMFRANWIFLGPERWAGEMDAWFTAWIGDVPVIAWRGADGLGVFVNRCLGSDRPLATALRGSSGRLRCACHGWWYAPVAAAGAATPDPVLRVERRAGLLFGCLDPDASSLDAQLGEFAFYFDAVATSLPGGIAVAGEQPMVTRLACNWKLGAEAYSGDLYRDLTASRATREALGDDIAPRGFQAACDAGAVVMADAVDGADAGPLEGMRPISATLFPNLSFDGRAPALHVWQPRGPAAMEVWTYALAGADDSDDEVLARQRACRLLFGPTGLETGDLAPVWAAATAASRGPIARGHRCNLRMGLGRERRTNVPGMIADVVSESNQRRFYSWWQAELGRLASAPPRRQRLHVVRPDRASHVIAGELRP